MYATFSSRSSSIEHGRDRRLRLKPQRRELSALLQPAPRDEDCGLRHDRGLARDAARRREDLDLGHRDPNVKCETPHEGGIDRSRVIRREQGDPRERLDALQEVVDLEVRVPIVAADSAASNSLYFDTSFERST